MGRATREPTLPGSPYVIVHQIENRLVAILRILHGRMQWP
ncbi:MAG: type II toxin-antitoxin system RelE/ParE family toxin [Desulfovibrionaceae bacterium]|nr:type II toxin-antitoxin system RelE/ParE family toxin [Desulfovibrionaceae bacterium]MBF0514594.1 type II toxin-antitoxin system RelE/ParE family toxin [Desulfovibrionaceae bacterium]